MIPLHEKIKSVPAFRSLTFFSAGIIGHEYFVINLCPLILASITISGILSLFALYYIFNSSLSKLLPASIIYISLAFAGYGISSLESSTIPLTGKGIYLAEVVSLPERKEKSTLLRLLIKGEVSGRRAAKHKQIVNAYFANLDSIPMPKPGEKIIFKAELNKIKNQGNPFEFDYARYLSRKNIFTSCFINEKCWKLLPGSGQLNNVHTFSLAAKEWLTEYIRKTALKKGGHSYEVLLAICTGDKSEISQDVKTSYSDAGAMHVMAVSGLHVGMIWAFFGYLTFFLKRSRFGRYLQFLMILAILWFYAFLTGLSPSVVRSCTMFTIASIANLLKRNKGIYNSLFLAALIQLTFNPQLLFEAGFQFSYTAVLSILLFQPLFCNLFSPKNIVYKRLADLASVSISAQILTFPLAVFYFHQFPVYFLLTNICIIPLVTILIMVFLLSVIFLPSPFISENLLFLSLFIAELMNSCTQFIKNIPGSILKNLSINSLQMILYLFSTLLVLRFILVHKYAIFSVALVFLAVIIGVGSFRYASNHKDSLTVYNVRGSAAIEIYHGANHYLLLNDSTIHEKDIEYAAEGNRNHKRYGKPTEIIFNRSDMMTDSQSFYKLPGCGNLVYKNGGIGIAIISDYSILQTHTTSKVLFVDALILAGNDIPDINSLTNMINPRWLIVSPTVPVYIPDPEVVSLNTHYHRISKEGGFVMVISEQFQKKL